MSAWLLYDFLNLFQNYNIRKRMVACQTKTIKIKKIKIYFCRQTMPDSLGATVTYADWTSGYEETTVNRNLGRYATPQGAYDTELVVFISIFGIVGIVLNIAALVILMQKKNRRAATNMYLVTLAVGEL